MNNLDIIYAEAAVRSKRKDYLSIFNRQVEITQDNLRQFWGDPLVIKQAVEKLKTSGFGIVSVGKITVGIIGSPELFTQVFKVELTPTEAADGTVSYLVKTVKDGQSPYLIDVSQSEFNTLLAGLALVPEAQSFVSTRGNTDPSLVDLSQIPELLNGWKSDLAIKSFGVNNWPATRSASVMIIDSGCDRTHLYFENKNAISVANSPPFAKTAESHLKNLMARQKRETFNEALPGEIQAAQARLTADELEQNAHGTSVVGHLVSILQALPKVKIDVMKIDDVLWFPEVSDAQQQPLVINCSHGPQDSLDNYYSNLFKDDVYYINVLSTIIMNVIVVVAVGNANSGKPPPNEINTSTQIPGVIVVGGVYKDKDGTLVASDGTHGFPAGFRNNPSTKAVPHVCGISGPVPKPILNSPVAGNEWKLRNGSSFAAPQVAGVCAIIKAHCPIATPLEVKEILIRTATPVTEGRTAQGCSLSEIKHQFGAEEFPTGLVNLEKAFWTAVWYNMFKMLGPQYTIKDAVAEAERMMIAK
jgi:serine protease AprX